MDPIFDPMILVKTGDELRGRVKAGVDCEECKTPTSASGWCITCKKVLCPDHDMEHLLRNCHQFNLENKK